MHVHQLQKTKKKSSPENCFFFADSLSFDFNFETATPKYMPHHSFSLKILIIMCAVIHDNTWTMNLINYKKNILEARKVGSRVLLAQKVKMRSLNFITSSALLLEDANSCLKFIAAMRAIPVTSGERLSSFRNTKKSSTFYSNARLTGHN